MRTLFKLLLFLIVIGGLGLVGYAYLGDMEPERAEVREPVVIDVD